MKLIRPVTEPVFSMQMFLYTTVLCKETVSFVLCSTLLTDIFDLELIAILHCLLEISNGQSSKASMSIQNTKRNNCLKSV